MKKGFVILFILMIIPNIISAKCDTVKHEQAKEDISNVTYSIDYNSTTKKFSVTFDNTTSDMYIKYLKSDYKSNDSKIVISSISEGTNMKLYFYNNDGCEDEISIKSIKIPFYNTFYNSAICKEYVGILTVCSSQFTTTKVTRELVDDTIYNYKNNTIELPKKEEEVIIVEKSIIEKVKDFSVKWGLKIIFVIGSSLITIIIGNSLYRKELHGV